MKSRFRGRVNKLGTWLVCRRVCFPSQILVMESFQTVGMCILVFIVLPKVDMIRAIFLMNATCIVPAFCKIAFGRPPRFGPSKEKEQTYIHMHSELTPEELEHRQQQINEMTRFNRIKKVAWYIINFAAFLIQASAIIILLFGQFESLNIGMEISGRFYAQEPQKVIVSAIMSSPLGDGSQYLSIFKKLFLWRSYATTF